MVSRHHGSALRQPHSIFNQRLQTKCNIAKIPDDFQIRKPNQSIAMGDTYMKGFLIFFVSIFSMMFLGSLQAADRVWEDGSVWSITYAETKPGQFNAYMDDLSKVWRTFVEREKQDGDVLSYRVLSVSSPRDGEPNVMFLVEYKNWAAFDKGVEYFDKISAEIMGSTEQSDAASIDREALRTLRGGLNAQEVVFK